jgi:uncharacterized protein (DUF58 family)
VSVAARLESSAQAPDTASPRAGVVLTQNRIYILPTRSGLLLGATVLVMLLGCINYNLGLGYVLTFLLVGIALVALLHTFRNLARLELLPGRAQPVFAGDLATFPVLIDNRSRQPRYAVGVGVADAMLARSHAAPQPVLADIAASAQAIAELRLLAVQRGRMRVPRLRISSTFPLGLFRAWSYVQLDMNCIVYPRPEGGEVPQPPAREGDEEGLHSDRGTDDFAGLRKYHPGDSLRHVAWKAVARGQPLMTKQFEGHAAGALWLRWEDTPAFMRAEARISRLTRWVLDAGRAGVPFTLELPGAMIAANRGPDHEARCLTALALLKIRP